jgi:hypothetical protein
MSIESHIIHTIPVFDVQDMLEEPIHFFKNSIYSHVAITKDQKLLGLLSENDLESFEGNKSIATHKGDLETFYARKETSWLDVLEIFSRNEANLVPVLDEEAHVMGYYDLNDIVGVFIDTPFFKEPGAILVLAKGIKDYSFSEIAQIVESNNTKLIGAFITDSRSEVVQITLKIGMDNFNEVVNTFRRYNYTILFGNKTDQFLEDLKERSDYLDKFLNV